MKSLILTTEVRNSMRRRVQRIAPLEACGLLAGRYNRVEMNLGVRNIDQSPVRFHMDPKEQWRAFQRIEAAGLELLGIYHSHPDGPELPSEQDIGEAMYSVVQIIWSRRDGKWSARGFWIDSGKVREVTLDLAQ
jgi:[CysO sulfur-carrier protein]-S-L-cysteine hydrolase